MTEEATEAPAGQSGLLLRRPGIPVGLVGAVIALSALAEWPSTYYVFARSSMVTAAGLLALFSVLAMASTNRRANAACLGAAMVIGAFWLNAFGSYGREVNMVADVATAAVFVVAGLFISPQTKFKLTGVAVCLLLGVGFTWWSTTSALNKQQEWEECIAEASSIAGEDPVEYCNAVLYPAYPDDL